MSYKFRNGLEVAFSQAAQPLTSMESIGAFLMSFIQWVKLVKVFISYKQIQGKIWINWLYKLFI